MRRVNLRWLLAIPLILILALIAFVVWAATPSGATMPEAQTAMTSTANVQVTQGDWLVFTPADAAPDTGFIFYPGGRVLVDSYAPMGQRLADEGYLVVMVPMPLNLAVLAPGRAADVISAYPEIEQWAIGGHSLGGAMAANFVRAHSGAVDGLVLWAAYPQASDSLADRDDLVVTSIYGSEDGLATVTSIEESRQYLPATTRFVEIEGGNHAQFGWYGDQAGDNPAVISREAQQDIVYEATRALLEAIRQES
jgi:dienelactone hydrolase